MYNYVIKYFDDGEKVTKKICNLVCIKVMQLIIYKGEVFQRKLSHSVLIIAA